MATLRVTSLRGSLGTSPELPDGAVVTGVTTTGSAIVGACYDNASGVGTGAGIITATSFVGSGEGLTGVASTDNIVTGTAATFTAGVNISGSSNVSITGVILATSFEGSGALLTGLPAGFTELDAALFNLNNFKSIYQWDLKEQSYRLSNQLPVSQP